MLQRELSAKYAEGQRDRKVDSLRGFLIILVVIGHVVQYVYSPDNFDYNIVFRLIYSFHVPAFMFLSGYVTYGRMEIKWVIKRVISLMVPFIVWSCIKCKFDMREVAQCFLYVDRSIWFVWVLAFVTILAYLGAILSKKIGIFAYILINMIILLIPINIFGLGFIKIHYTWFALGLFAKYSSKLMQKKMKWIGNISVVSWLFLVQFWMRVGGPSFVGNIYFDGLQSKIFSILCLFYIEYLVPLFGIVAVYYVWDLLWKFVSKHDSFLVVCGRYTMACYILQFYLFITPLNNRILDSIISFVLALLIPLGVGWLCSKNKWINFFLFCGKIPV